MSSSPPPPASGSPVNRVRSILSPERAWIYLALFLVIVGVFQWGSILHSKFVKQRRPPKSVDEESTSISTRTRKGGRGWSFARIPLAAVNVFRVVAFRWSLEFGTYDLKGIDIFLTSAYITFLLGWTFGGGQDLAVTTMNAQRWTNRAGQLAASQFPLVTALGTKNNIVSLITGVGYEKLNILHRITARSCFGLLLIHVGGKIYSARPFLRLFLEQTWFRFGITAMVSLAILIIVSLRAIRTRAYELFFYTHSVAVLILLIGAYFHTRETRNSHWIWPSFVFWALDRLTRLARVVICNHLYCTFYRHAKLQDATTELLSDDFVRVRVRRPPHFQWLPGQTAYLTMPSVSAFPLETHPFTISSIDSALFRTTTRNGDSDTANWKELVFLINVRRGVTKRLREVAAKNRTAKVFIDGPYGSAPDMASYDTSIFIAGGSGITYTLPVFLNVIEAAERGSSRCRRVVFIWAVPNASHIQWISEPFSQIHGLIPAWLTLSIRIFVTQGDILGSEINSVDMERTPDKEGSDNWILSPSVRLENGRPDLKSILQEEVSTAMGRLGVTVCGPQSMTRSVRRALRFPVSGPSSILSGGPSVTLHVESFGYA